MVPSEKVYDQHQAQATLEIIEAHPKALAEYKERFEGNDKKARELLHLAIASRMIVAAAQGGELRRLIPGGLFNPHYYFEVRQLLPCWVRVEEWGPSRPFNGSPWHHAATLLRSFLAHASLRTSWLDSSRSSGTALDRSLSLQDLYTLRAFFENTQGSWYRGAIYGTVVKYFLPWLFEDAELARKVLDTWNEVVKSGRADKVKCMCRECTTGVSSASLRFVTMPEY